MITKAQAIDEDNRSFHHGHCSRKVGKRGGIQLFITKVRRNGRTRVWRTRLTEFSVPFKYGMYQHGYITDVNRYQFHLASECPLDKEG